MWQRDRLDIDRRTYEPEELLGSPRPAMNWTFTRRHLIPLAAAAIIAAGQLLSFSSQQGVTMQFGGRSLDCILIESAVSLGTPSIVATRALSGGPGVLSDTVSVWPMRVAP
jgi:hypothetical protein